MLILLSRVLPLLRKLKIPFILSSILNDRWAFTNRRWKAGSITHRHPIRLIRGSPHVPIEAWLYVFVPPQSTACPNSNMTREPALYPLTTYQPTMNSSSCLPVMLI